ncbi:MAG: Stk1 family PASTA domain-containing Ser/Thr kinase [Clostridia bacterium]|nr:Stk1 family PASTA domain-containing Ser/Thr kinase [Clostridia bacterium]
MIGRILAERYKVEAVIGEGGMSKVWRATDLNTGKTVAVKVLKEEYQDDEAFVRRFEQEALAASRMSHPNIANLLDVGAEEDGTRYLVIEYVPGKTLKEYIRENGTLRPEMASQIIIRVLAAVQHAHQNGVIHRDIKPQNILIDKNGAIKVSDFGIARVANAQTASHEGDAAMGSVYYFSPEQAKGAETDEKSDIYSVGVMFYEMLTGRVPFTGDTPDAIAIKHMREPPTPPSEVNGAVSTAMDFVVLHAIAKRPRSRYQSAQDMLRDVRTALDHPDTILTARADMLRRERDERLAEKRKKRIRQRVKWMRAILVSSFSLVLVIIIVIAASTIMKRILVDSRKDRIEMPNLIGLSKEDAISRLTENELNPALAYGQSPLVTENLVADQSVPPGTLVAAGETVTITISQSEFDIRLSSYVGMAVDKAIVALSEISIVGETNYVLSDARPDIIVSQNPVAGTLMNRGDSVILSVSTGSVTMPILIDMSRFEVEQAVLACDIVLSELVQEIVDDPTQIGRVIRQMPEPFTRVRPKSTVQVTIGVPSTSLFSSDVILDLSQLRDGGNVSVTMEDTHGDELVQYAEVFPEGGLAAWPIILYSQTARQTTYHVYFDDQRQLSAPIVFKP